MTPCTALSFAAALAATPAPTATRTAEDSLAGLLQKLAAHDARLEQLKKSGVTITSRIDELDSDGKVTHSLEQVLRVSEGRHRPEQALVRAVEDGKDITEKRRKQLAEEKGTEVEARSPFGASAQAQYGYELVGADPAGASLVRIKYAPRGEKSDQLVVGEALVDSTSGELVRLTQHPAENPRFVKALEMVLEFDAQTSAGRAMSKVEIRAEAGLLFIKKRFHTVTTFTDYGAGEDKRP